MIHMMESQANYILKYLELLEEQLRGQQNAAVSAFLDLKPAVQQAYNEKLGAQFRTTVWATGGCKSWYFDRAGRNTTLYPRLTARFRRETRNIIRDEYEATVKPYPKVPGGADSKKADDL
jgi:hypothetical protein